MRQMHTESIWGPKQGLSYKTLRFWYKKYFGTKSILVQKVFWYKKYFGTKSILVQKAFWYKKYFGTKSILVQKVFWYKKYFGTKSILVQKVFWYKKYFGTKSILVQKVFWFYCMNILKYNISLYAIVEISCSLGISRILLLNIGTLASFWGLKNIFVRKYVVGVWEVLEKCLYKASTK